MCNSSTTEEQLALTARKSSFQALNALKDTLKPLFLGSLVDAEMLNFGKWHERVKLSIRQEQNEQVAGLMER